MPYKIKEFREKHNMTQLELCKGLKYPVKSYSNLKTARNKIQPFNAQNIY